MEIVIGMVLAFMLGAYIRQPILFKQRVEPIKEKEEVDKELKKMLEDGAKLDKKRQIQFMNAIEWNGKKVKLDDED